MTERIPADPSDSLILYPRRYNRRGEEGLHSVLGLTSDGREVNVKLRIPEEYRSNSHAPRISEFARTDRKAPAPCISSESNGPERREGVLLFTGVVAEGTGRRGVDDYVARWAVVLAEDSDSPDPLIGLGRVAIHRDSLKTRRLHDQIERADERSDRARVARLERSAADPANFVYPLVLYHPQASVRVACSNATQVHETLASTIEQFTRHGRAGGALVRLITPDGAVVRDSGRELFNHYRNDLGGYDSGERVVEAFFRHDAPRWFAHPEYMLDITPLERVSTSPSSARFFGSPGRFESVRHAYYDDNDEPVLCRIVARVRTYPGSGFATLYRAYPLSPPLGCPANLDPTGDFLLPLEGQRLPCPVPELDEAHMSELPVVRTHAQPPQRATWLFGDTALEPPHGVGPRADQQPEADTGAGGATDPAREDRQPGHSQGDAPNGVTLAPSPEVEIETASVDESPALVPPPARRPQGPEPTDPAAEPGEPRSPGTEAPSGAGPGPLRADAAEGEDTQEPPPLPKDKPDGETDRIARTPSSAPLPESDGPGRAPRAARPTHPSPSRSSPTVPSKTQAQAKPPRSGGGLAAFLKGRR